MEQHYPHALPKGYELGRYVIEAVLGAGGFAITYLAHHAVLDQKVAIKEYLPDECGVRIEGRTTVRAKRGEEEEFAWGLDRFTHEAQTLAKFDHPSIVPVTDIFEANGTAYMVMPYQEGESLETRLDRVGALPEQELRQLLDPLLDALALVHASNILHRDIKPSNIFIRTDGTPVLLDFGNARQALGTKSRSLTATLTPGYAPNEQYVTRGNQGPWTDVYSLGATIYKAVVGSVPPEAPARAMQDTYVSAAKAAKDRYSPLLLSAIDRSLAFLPEDRPQDIGAVRDLLKSDTAKATSGTGYAGATLRPANVPKGRIAPTRQTTARRWAIGFAVLLVLTATAGGYVVVSGWSNSDTQTSGDTTERIQTEKARRELEQAREAIANARRKSAEETSRRAEAERRAKEAEKARLEAERQRKATEEARLRAEAEMRKRTGAEERRRAAEQNQKGARELVARAEQAIRNGDLNAARRHLNDAEKLEPGSDGVRSLRKHLASALVRRRTEEEQRLKAERTQRRQTKIEREGRGSDTPRRKPDRNSANAAGDRARQGQAQTAIAQHSPFTNKTAYLARLAKSDEATLRIRILFQSAGVLKVFCFAEAPDGKRSPCDRTSGMNGSGQWSYSGGQLCLTARVIGLERQRCYAISGDGSNYVAAGEGIFAGPFALR